MERHQEIRNIVEKYNRDRSRLMDIFWDLQAREGFISQYDMDTLAQELNTSVADLREVVTFYHFFRTRPSGRHQIYLDSSIVAEFSGMPAIRKAFEDELGIKVGETTPDGRFGLFDTACIGMSDQSPAALIDRTPVTNLTPERVHVIVDGLKNGKSIQEIINWFGFGDGANALPLMQSMVRNHVRKPGPFFFTPYVPGEALSRAEKMPPEQILEAIRKSGLRGRGGAGFPVATKWETCRSTPATQRFVVCNADEGEPGTFKDRVILTEHPQLLFEGMAIAARVVGATQGVIYLRAEYHYMLKYLNALIEQFHARHKGFNLRIQLGAGAYVCGEESALLESMEGRRGEPRLRPPFTAEKGYKGCPTALNNVETFALAAQIILRGPEEFAKLGTEKSKGVRLLSISGDVRAPGIYEVPWGIKLGEVLKMCEAIDPEVVQVGGPSGVCVSAQDVQREISYEDLSTGGSLMVFSKKRNLFDILKNFMHFFVDESCGNCTPCRAGNVILRDLLHKFSQGHARREDLAKIDQWSSLVVRASRCGLGSSAPNVLITSKRAFPEKFEKAIRESASDLFYDFDIQAETENYNRAIRELR